MTEKYPTILISQQISSTFIDRKQYNPALTVQNNSAAILDI
jgi:hypothetical protein